jgi:hypothetical protein
MNLILFLMDLLLHIAFVGIVIPIIFFTYGLYLQKKIIKLEVSKVVYTIIKPFIPFITEDIKNKYLNFNPNVTEDLNPDKEKYKVLAFISLGCLCGVSIIGFCMLCYIIGYVPVYIIINNIVLLIFVAITQILFFTYIATKYRPIDVEDIKRRLII